MAKNEQPLLTPYTTSAPHILYGAHFSLYTGKARAYLCYKQIPFKEIAATLRVYKNTIEPNTGVRFIPVLETPQGEFLQDTAVIMDTLEAQYPEPSVTPVGPRQKIVSALFELYGDEWLLLPAMHYRWNSGQDRWLYQQFGGLLLPKWPGFIQRFLGKKVGGKFRGFVPRLGIDNNTIPALEDWYEQQLLPALDKHFAQHDFLLGSAACVGDFGLAGSLYSHLYRDPEPGKYLRKHAPHVAEWAERINRPAKDGAVFLADDQIPETLMPLLQLLFRDHWPLVKDRVAKTQAWLQAHPSGSIPRSLGRQPLVINGAQSECMVLPFTQWKVQRILDAFARLNPPEQQQVISCLNEAGAQAPFDIPIQQRLTRENNQLVRETDK